MKNPRSGVAMAVQVDPAFDAISKATIESAVSRFVEVALDPAVINRAVDRSTPTPNPMPEKYELDNGKQKVDEIGRPVLTSAYSYYSQLRVKPIDAELFHRASHRTRTS